jgi:hypothetical protein
MNRSKVRCPRHAGYRAGTMSATAQGHPNAKGPIVKTENGRGRGGEEWAMVKEIIELAKTEVITVPPEQRKRILARARKEMAAWRRGQTSEAAAQKRVARRPAHRGSGRDVLPRRARAAN